MKKRFAGVLAALMVLVMGATTVFAAGSPTGEDVLVDELNKALTSVTAKHGSTTVAYSTSKVSKTEYQEAESNKKGTNDTIVAMTDIVGVTIPNGGSITVTLAVPGVRAGSTVYVMHKYKVGAGYVWEYLTPTVGNGTVTVTMKSFSPVYVVLVGPAAGSNNGSTSNGNTTGTNNPPVTGNNNNNTTGDSTSQTNNNNNNQSNSQTNNQNNPVNVSQNVTVNYPDREDGYDAGYEDGYNAAKNSNKGGTSSSGTSSSGSRPSAGGVVTAPKTGASLPALPFVALFAAAGIAVCGKKARKSDK